MRPRLGGALVGLLAFSVGCSSGSMLAKERGAGGAAAPLTAPGAERPELEPFQTRVRLSYDDGGGDVTLFVAWRLARRDRFLLEAKDRLGRTWWQLEVDGTSARFVEPRAGRVCSFHEAVEIDALPLGPVPFTELPSLLLGRLPTSVATVQWRDGRWRVEAIDGRRWTAAPTGASSSSPSTVAEPGSSSRTFDVDQDLAAWSLLSEEGEPVAWFERGERIARLSARGRPAEDGRGPSSALQLRWRLGKVAPLVGEIPALEVPVVFDSDGCPPQ